MPRDRKKQGERKTVYNNARGTWQQRTGYNAEKKHKRETRDISSDCTRRDAVQDESNHKIGATREGA